MPESVALLTDLYELTMMEGYLRGDLRQNAVFELFVRTMPRDRGFLVAAGLDQALSFLETLRFSPADLDALVRVGSFSRKLLDYLADLRFSGDVDAVPEGTILFEDEPLLRITAPLPEAQLVESRLLSLLNFETSVASKAARCTLAAPGKELVDFGMRRAHGFEAGLLAARASYIAGFAGTSTVLAGVQFGIPLYGTMAHSFVQAHDSEADAFVSFARAHPDHPILLIDTYDTEAAAEKVASLAPRLAAEGIVLGGVRIDSGALGQHAFAVRKILDQAGLHEVRIFASSGLDEWALSDLAAAPIDGFGVGAKLSTSADAPFLDCAYKLVEYGGKARRKRSEGKSTWPGRKQIHRRMHPDGTIDFDVVALDGEIDHDHESEPLLGPVMRRGVRVRPRASLSAIRDHAARQLGSLPAHLKRLASSPRCRVLISVGIVDLAHRIDEASS